MGGLKGFIVGFGVAALLGIGLLGAAMASDALDKETPSEAEKAQPAGNGDNAPVSLATEAIPTLTPTPAVPSIASPALTSTPAVPSIVSPAPTSTPANFALEFMACFDQLLNGQRAASSGNSTASIRSFVDANCKGIGIRSSREVPCQQGTELSGLLETWRIQNQQLGVDTYFVAFAKRELDAALSQNSCTLARQPDTNTNQRPTIPNTLGLSSRVIIAEDWTFLGTLDANKYDSESICNKFGDYGSEYSTTSIRNEYGEYGSEYNTMSAYNPYTSTPPRIFSGSSIQGYVTKNRYLPGAIDPDQLLISEGCPELVRR